MANCCNYTPATPAQWPAGNVPATVIQALNILVAYTFYSPQDPDRWQSGVPDNMTSALDALAFTDFETARSGALGPAASLSLTGSSSVVSRTNCYTASATYTVTTSAPCTLTTLIREVVSNTVVFTTRDVVGAGTFSRAIGSVTFPDVPPKLSGFQVQFQLELSASAGNLTIAADEAILTTIPLS